MRALNSHFVLIDLHTSWRSTQQIPNSTFGYLQKCEAAGSSFSAAIRRTRGRPGKISSSRAPEVRSPEIRRPRDWSTAGNGFLSVFSNTASTSSSGCRGDEVVSDMDLFLEIVPLRMRHELFRHEEIGKLIEVVMDLGRKPLARFPSGDWVISEQPVKPDDLRHAISKSVTLGDEEARKRKVQKTILERKGPPSFTCAVEMISKTECRVHHRLDATVDAILAGKSPLFEIRRLDAEANNPSESSRPTEEDRIGDAKVIPGKSQLIKARKADAETNNSSKSTEEHQIGDAKVMADNSSKSTEEHHIGDAKVMTDKKEQIKRESDKEVEDYFPKSNILGSNVSVSRMSYPSYVYTYKIQEADLLQVAAVMGLEDKIDVTDDIGSADAILASSYEMKQNPWICGVAKFHQLPVFVIKSTTMAQMVKAVRMILGMDSFSSKQKQSSGTFLDIEIEDDIPKRKPSLEEIDALEEVRLAIEYIVIPGGEPVELLPRRSEIVARQLELVESYQLAVENSGTESNPRLQILPQKLNRRKSKPSSSFFKIANTKPVAGDGGGNSVVRLPFLPE